MESSDRKVYPNDNKINGSTKQILTNFPNSDTKHIDYVIVFEAFKEIELKKKENFMIHSIREEYFNQLRKESFDIYFIEQDVQENIENQKKLIYVLLNCSNERLLQEAENIRLEMKLKHIELDQDQDKKRATKLGHWKNTFMKFKNRYESGFSAQYESNIRFIFEGVDELNNESSGPFNNTIRILLVNNILNNIRFLTKEEKVELLVVKKLKSIMNHTNTVGNKNKINSELTAPNNDNEIQNIYRQTKLKINRQKNNDYMSNLNLENSFTKAYKGLPYMLNAKYFLDAFCLHDETSHSIQMKNLLSYSLLHPGNNKNMNNIFGMISRFDMRLKLHNEWARFRKIFNYQPLQNIRDYFGESNALYFAWTGVFITCLWIPSIVGFLFFSIALGFSVKNLHLYHNSTNKSSIMIDFQKAFKGAFDNDAMPYFAMFICLWGIFFVQIWRRENHRLAFRWNVENFEIFEPDLPEYIQRKRARNEINSNSFIKFLYKNERLIKSIFSYSVMIILIGICCMELALVVLFRVYMKVRVFPNNETLKLIFGDFLSTIINTFFIMFMSVIYKIIVIKLTHWENHRTKTEYNDNLIIKLFIFEFVNNYGPLIYLAYFRNLNLGLFGLGDEMKDRCDNCMALLNLQVFTFLITQPMPRLFTSVLMPFINDFYKNKIKFRKKIDSFRNRQISDAKIEENDRLKMNENAVLIYLNTERNKAEFGDTIVEEYCEKIIIYGYLTLFGCAFTLGPLFLLVINLIDMRVDAQRILWLYRRPVGYKAQDIGSWLNICIFLNVIGIINHSFLIGFFSDWSEIKWGNSNQIEKFAFVLLFEHIAFFLAFLIMLFLSDLPGDVKKKMREKAEYLKYIVSNAKAKKHDDLNASNNSNGIDTFIKRKNDLKNGLSHQTLPPLQKPLNNSFNYNKMQNDHLFMNRSNEFIFNNNDNNHNGENDLNATTLRTRSKYKKYFGNNHISKDYDSCDV